MPGGKPIKKPVSEAQRRFFGAELGRLRAGKKTQTGISEEELSVKAAKPKGKKLPQKVGKGQSMAPGPVAPGPIPPRRGVPAAAIPPRRGAAAPAAPAARRRPGVITARRSMPPGSAAMPIRRAATPVPPQRRRAAPPPAR